MSNEQLPNKRKVIHIDRFQFSICSVPAQLQLNTKNQKNHFTCQQDCFSGASKRGADHFYTHFSLVLLSYSRTLC